MRYVIIGNGIAGISAAESIRGLDRESSITIIAGETFSPYCRPMISMVLEGSIPMGALPIRPSDYYEAWGIEPLLGQWVRRIDVEARTVVTDRDTVIPFDALLIATGADPRRIKTPGSGLGNIFPLRSQEHVRGMVATLDGATHALVLGGGLVGFKAAHGFLKRGLKVTMLIKSSYPLVMQVDPEAGGMILRELLARGLDVRVDCEVETFEGNGTVREASLSDGTRVACDIAVVGKGVNPAVSFIPRDKIKVDLGVVVDDHLQTGVESIYAAGDVAEHFDVARQCRWVNAIWPVAVEQGRIAGMNMAGRKVVCRGSLGRNVIRIYGLDVMTAGIVNPPEDGAYETLVRRNPANGWYRKIVFRENVPVGMVLVNRIEQGGVLMHLIRQKVEIAARRERLLDPSFNVRQLFP